MTTKTEELLDIPLRPSDYEDFNNAPFKITVSTNSLNELKVMLKSLIQLDYETYQLDIHYQETIRIHEIKPLLDILTKKAKYLPNYLVGVSKKPIDHLYFVQLWAQ
ncbi:hypothetical protein N7548_00120 [Acholeplasma manati]|uniref:Uncharacterized protein n=1 Tax=Paracholeplasma manati TaxID=591373 RepID=A0ABT2Y3B6_9MOLU|nr:hypothetical protein [Paracholeplasma manati]MCV2231230.1 hypothetical protein [Paracholeplasma manati]